MLSLIYHFMLCAVLSVVICVLKVVSLCVRIVPMSLSIMSKCDDVASVVTYILYILHVYVVIC